MTIDAAPQPYAPKLSIYMLYTLRRPLRPPQADLAIRLNIPPSPGTVRLSSVLVDMEIHLFKRNPSMLVGVQVSGHIKPSRNFKEASLPRVFALGTGCTEPKTPKPQNRFGTSTEGPRKRFGSATKGAPAICF